MACTLTLTCCQITLDVLIGDTVTLAYHHNIQLWLKGTCFISRLGDIVKGIQHVKYV